MSIKALQSICYLLSFLLFVGIAMVEATPPGIAKNPSHATCKIKKYKHCYNLVHVCPKFCPDQCTVECVSCKPICSGSSGSSPIDDSSPTPSIPTPSTPTPSTPHPTPTPTPSTPFTPTPSTKPSIPTPSTPSTSTPSAPYPHPTPTPTPSTPYPHPTPTPTPTPYPHPTPTPTPSTPYPHPTPTPSTPSTSTPSSPSTPTPAPTPTPSTPSTSTPSSPSTPTPTPSTPSPSTPTPTPTPSTPTTPTPSTPHSPNPNSTTSTPSASTLPTTATPSSPLPPSTPSSSPSPSTPSSPNPHPSQPKTSKCKNKNFPQCYNMEHVCPNSCPGGCEVDCVTCKPICNCDKPGAVCQDPRFIGGDGITFYFHGKKDEDFCLVSDSNLHINAHFIGRRNQNMKRDFTWVQSIAILFGKHQLFLGALNTSTWDDSVDRLSLTFNGEPITLSQSDGDKWEPTNAPISVSRISDTNNVEVEVNGLFKITAKVVPITEEDSRIHNYGVTEDDCLAHLDLGFKFYSLSDEVNGVLGQTYGRDYVSGVKIGAIMPVMGGDKMFRVSNVFAADCAVARFDGVESGDSDSSGMDFPGLSCGSGIDGRGVVCKR